jgi:hypothetical protein
VDWLAFEDSCLGYIYYPRRLYASIDIGTHTARSESTELPAERSHNEIQLVLDSLAWFGRVRPALGEQYAHSHTSVIAADRSRVLHFLRGTYLRSSHLRVTPRPTRLPLILSS